MEFDEQLILYLCYCGGMADTGDLKSPFGCGVRVQVPPVAPILKLLRIMSFFVLLSPFTHFYFICIGKVR